MKRSQTQPNCHNPGCDICRYKLPFELPTHLLQSARDLRLVLFAGAGVSTEKRTVIPSSFHETIAQELRAPRSTPFPDLMSMFAV